MPTVTVDLPEEAFSALRRSPGEFAREMQLAAAMLWYSRGMLSQERAAEIAGLNRKEFWPRWHATKSTFSRWTSRTCSESWIVAEPAVLNASPLILLAGSGFTDILRMAGSPLQVPRAVVDEIDRFGAADATACAIDRSVWLDIVDPGPAPATIGAWDLGRGEEAVLTWAHANPGTVAILDDLPARRCADALGIPLRGTLGLILAAKRRGAIPDARPILERLRAAGMYLSDEVLRSASSRGRRVIAWPTLAARPYSFAGDSSPAPASRPRAP